MKAENLGRERVVLFRRDSVFDGAHQLFMARGDGRGQVSGRPEFQQRAGDSPNPLGAVGHHVVAAAAVEVRVDEAWHDDAPPGVDNPRAGLRLDRARRADGFDVAVFAQHDAVFDHFVPRDDIAADDC